MKRRALLALGAALLLAPQVARAAPGHVRVHLTQATASTETEQSNAASQVNRSQGTKARAPMVKAPAKSQAKKAARKPAQAKKAARKAKKAPAARANKPAGQKK